MILLIIGAIIGGMLFGHWGALVGGYIGWACSIEAEYHG